MADDPDRPSNVTPVDFTKPRRLAYQHVEGGVYRDPRTGGFYERPYIHGRQTWRKLKAKTLRAAQKEKGKKRADQASARFGLAHDPYVCADVWTVQQLVDFYVKAGCPKRDEQPRVGKQLKDELARVKQLQAFFGKRRWLEVNLETCREYHAWRLQQIVSQRNGQPAAGHRTVDMELVALSAVFRWALRNPGKTRVSSNPVARDRNRFARPEKVRHCRSCQPADATELHKLASHLFTGHRSEVLGWQLLIEALIGQRTHEVLKLRWDAKNRDEPGYIDSSHLYLYRSATNKGTYPFIRIHKALGDCIDALREWHALRYPLGPCGTRQEPGPVWWFPSPQGGGKSPILASALTHALRRICPLLGIPHRTSHGLRSYYVNVLRSQGLSDAEIALRIGHKTGGRLIVDVYGEILPHKIGWLPEAGRPAWEFWQPQPGAEQLELHL